MALTRADVIREDPVTSSEERISDGVRRVGGRLCRALVLRPRRAAAAGVAAGVILAGAIWLMSAPGGARGLPSSRADLGLPPAGADGELDASGAASGGGDQEGRGVASDSGSGGLGTVWVHVAGAVVAPGVYKLAAGSRAADAMAVAGGPTSEADLGAINLAAELADGVQVFIPGRADSVSSGSGAGGASAAGSGSGSGAAGNPGAKININKADASQLEDLPGVGPATSAKIVAFRKANGPFRSVGELRKVDGIGEAKLAQIAPRATV